MNELRVFYAIYVAPGPFRSALDAIRMIARPQARHAAHVTVRGPYSDYRDPREWSAAIRGKPIDIGGIGTFFDGDQNTVFLHVESPDLQLLWDKPDYPAYNPHLTIYDGPSRSFAESLRDLLAAREPQFTFLASGVEPMVSGNGLPPLITRYEPSDLAPFMAHPPTRSDVEGADVAARLAWIAELADYLVPTLCEA